LSKKLLGEVCDGHTFSTQSHPSLVIIGTVVNGKLIHAMLDTGATTSLISQTELNQLEHSPIQTIQTTATLGDGQTKIMVNGSVELNVTINNITTVITVLIVESLGANLILGMDWCKLNNVTVNFGQNQVEINHPEHGTTITPFLDDDSVDVRLAESVTLLPHHEHIVRMHVSVSAATHALFSPDFKKCVKLNIQVPEAIVEIKDFSFYV
jgi:predicted aspartyl protease